jgi:hemerythrin superfamily protein
MIGRVKREVVKAHMALSGDWEAQLKAEHKAVRALLRALVKTSADEEDKRRAILEGVADALTRHAVEEENVVYPALRELGADLEAGELYDEHAEMKTLIGQMKAMAASDPMWIGKAQALKKLVYAHAREEETNLFPLLRSCESELEAEALTGRLQHEGLRVTG